MTKLKSVVALILLAAGIVWAQTGAGNVQGTVKDTTGAVVPGANLAITHSQTGREYKTTSNVIGFYLFPPLQVGAYQLSVEAPGMEAWKGDLTLQVGQTAQVDVTLRVGTSTTQITVAGDVSPIITTTSPTLGAVVERARIEQLPMNTRYIYNLLSTTVPGIEGGRYLYSWGIRWGTEFLQDGAVIENRDSGFINIRPQGMDTIEEFRVETNNSAAKMSRPGTVMTNTRSGTNEVHGSAFETARNNSVGVARARQDYYVKPPHLVRNEFGVSLGGPVYLPKLFNGKNRTFFFFAYEGLRNMTNVTRSASMPTLAMREGDFSGLANSQGRLYTLYDPWSTNSQTWQRQPFTNNQIPKSRQSPLSKYVNSVTPAPTLTAVNPLAGKNWFGLGFNNTRQHTETARVDHRLSDRDQMFFRYTHSVSGQFITNALGGGPTTLDNKANAYLSNTANDSGVASWTHVFSPTLFSETVVAVSRDFWGQIPVSGLEDIATPLGLPNPFKGLGFPGVTNTGFNMDYYGGVAYTLNVAKIFKIDQNFTKVYGRHEFQFGVRIRHELLNTLVDQSTAMGNSNYGSVATGLYDPKSGSSYSAVSYTGHNSANLFLGIAGEYSADFNRPWYNMRAGERAGYFQDNFKVNSRLTLNLGLRYEYNPAIREENNVIAGFDPKTKSVVLSHSIDELVKMGYTRPEMVSAYSRLGVKFTTPKEAGLPEHLVYPNRWDFGPRAGFAYRLEFLNRPVVLRGGYGLYAYAEPMRDYNGTNTTNVPMWAKYTRSFTSAAESPDGLPNYALRSVPTVIAGVNSSDVLNNPSGITRGNARLEYFNPHQPTARAHQWNLTLEREMLANTSFKVGYVGTHGTRMNQFVNLNENPNSYVWYATTGLPMPTGEYSSVARRPLENTVFGKINEYRKSGWSNNNSFTVEVQRRYSKGYAFQAYYTMSNALRAAGDGWRDDYLPGVNQFLPGAVPTDDQERNRLINYRRDTNIPKHRFNWNWIVDLPFGRGKALGRNAGGLLDRLIGGWQIAGTGNILNRYFELPTINWNAGEVEVYGLKYPIQDCRSGVCYDGYLYYNGYIPANRINSYGSNGKPNGVMGVPSNYKPAHTPLIPTPANGGSSSDPMYAYYETNYVWVPMKNGALQRVDYNNNLHPWRNQYVPGPMSRQIHASAFKTTRIKERVTLRFNADFFNVLNMPLLRVPDSETGIISKQYSGVAARSLQLTLRLSW